MFCPKCGEKNPDGARFCARCGAAIAAAGPVSGPVPAPPRRRSRVPLVAACAVAAVAVVVAAALVLPGLLGGGRAAQERQASNAALSYGRGVVSSGDYDYLYSTSVGGICRVKRDGSAVELIRPIDSSTYWVPALAVDGDTVFFVLDDFTDGGGASELRSVRADGSEEKLVTTSSAFGGGSQTISQLCVYDHKVYVTSTVNGSTQVYTMGADGSGLKMIFNQSNASSPIVLSDAVYYITNLGGSYTLMAWDPGTNQVRTIYSGTGASAGALCMAGGRLVYTEYPSSGNMSVVSISTDGQDRRVLWANMSDDAYGHVAAASNDAVYLVFYVPGSYEVWNLLRVPLDGSDVQTVAQNLTYYNPTVCDMGGRLVICENGGDISGANMRVMSVSYDGTSQVTYPLG